MPPSPEVLLLIAQTAIGLVGLVLTACGLYLAYRRHVDE